MTANRMQEHPFWGMTNLFGRVIIGIFFIGAALSKLFNWEETIIYMNSVGLPASGAGLPAIIVLEILGGLAILVGWRTQLMAFLLAAFTMWTTFLFYADFSDVLSTARFWKNIALAGALFCMSSQYPSMWSLDRMRLEPDMR